MIKTIVLVLAIAAVTGCFWYVYFYRKERRLLGRLQDMVDQASEGTLERQEISESKVSALENSLKRYLDDTLLAGENRQKQKETIQGLISDISHQTLTPISNLKIYSELLREELGGQSEAAEIIWEQTEKLDFLIQSLVKLSRLENGIIAVTPVTAELSPLLSAIRQEYGAKAREKNICFDICQTDLCAAFDLKWTIEAVGNIVDNGIKYTSPGGKLTITVEEYSFFLRMDIADTGTGMEEDELPRIFTRFYRGLEVSEQPGVGIGLYLAREIIQAQKGYIKVTSRKGKGSVFSVFLPKSEPEQSINTVIFQKQDGDIPVIKSVL